MFAPPTRQLRKFGMVMAGAFGALGGLLFWRHGLVLSTRMVLAVALTFAIAGLVAPRLLGPVEWAWMKLSAVLSYVMTRVILTVAFFLVVTPAGAIARLIGSGLQLRPRREVQSYWVPVDREHGPGTRHRAPF